MIKYYNDCKMQVNYTENCVVFENGANKCTEKLKQT